jgi:hypothetical protein
MTGELAPIVRCLDLQERHIVAAIVDRAGTKALLVHLAEVSAPDTGGAKALLVFARMATTDCNWLDGDLLVELVEASEGTRIEVVTDLGGGLRERVFPSLHFQVPLIEFARAVARVSHMIAPLRIRAKSAQSLLLGASQAARRTSMPPPIGIAVDSLFLPGPAAPPPGETDDGALPEVLAAVTIDAADREVDPADVDAGWDD